MNSFIISGGSQQARHEESMLRCKNLSINTFDITTISSLDESEQSLSIGIKAITVLAKKIFLKPLKGQNKAIIILNGELLTVFAQNALLKLLEEPPENTYIFLLTTHTDHLLQTIRSRCKIIKLASSVTVDLEKIEQARLQWKAHKTNSISDNLKEADVLAKNKELALMHISDILYGINSDIQEALHLGESAQEKVNDAVKLLAAIKDLKETNTNPRLVMEHLFL